MHSILKRLLSVLIAAACLAGFSQRTILYIDAASSPPEPPPDVQPTPTSEITLEYPAPIQNTAPEATETPSETPVELKYTYGPNHFPNGINPLTGLPVSDPTILQRRPMAIKITNYPRSVRPQWGLNLADHIYEYHIGDDMTRFIGVFYGNDAERVGPVRSARLFDEDVVRMYKAFFVFGYADPKVRDELFDEDLIPFLIFETPNNCPPICRYDNGLAYNNLFADTAGLTRYFAEKGKNNDEQDLDGLLFDFAVPPGGQMGENFSIYYTYVSYNRWAYDADLGRYLRNQEIENDNGQELTYAPLMDELSGSQVSASNVVVLYVAHETFYKSSSTWILDISLKGHGTGYGFRDGQIYPLFWSHKATAKMINLYFADGEPYPLKPGNVWFEVIGETSQEPTLSDNSWNFSFGIP
jgi:hypothetical protein